MTMFGNPNCLLGPFLGINPRPQIEVLLLDFLVLVTRSGVTWYFLVLLSYPGPK